MTIRIVTDSTCDIPPETAAAHGIVVVPAYINIGDRSYLDGVELSRRDFYAQLPGLAQQPTTAAPSSGAFCHAYEALAAEGATAILSIHVASKLSGVLNAARLGAEESSGVPIQLFDSEQVSMGLGLLAITAADMARAGATMSQIVAALHERLPRTHVYAVLDTLEYVRRSGRVGWTQFGLGTVLRIKPLVHVYAGEVQMLERIRTHKRAVDRLLELVAELGPLEKIALLHICSPEGGEALRQQARHLFPPQTEPLAVEVGPAIGSHVGPGGLGIACIAGQL
jgi:DegV family protein with EDD domain